MLTIAEAAELVGVSRMTVYNWTRKGLRSEKFGKGLKVSREDVLAFAAGRKAAEPQVHEEAAS